jgi:hypothetical protein
MKVVDDKLRIIDDVPSSAVELAVKDKVSGIQGRKASLTLGGYSPNFS